MLLMVKNQRYGNLVLQDIVKTKSYVDAALAEEGAKGIKWPWTKPWEGPLLRVSLPGRNMGDFMALASLWP